MKKIFAILALAVSASAFAGSFGIESQNVGNVGSADQKTYALGIKHDFTNAFAGDLAISNTQTDGTNALSTRLEAGATLTQPLFGSVKGYVRGAYGQKYSNTTDFSYFSVEPGVTAPIGPFTAKVGFRYRSATDSIANNDQTHTVRTTLAYPLTKADTIAVRYDRVKGDNNQKIVVLAYTRGF
jgi:hypothetical protein